MVESRWQRWSRKKAEANRKVEPTPAPTTAPEVSAPEPSPEQQELAINETLSEQALLEKYGLPDPASIEIGTDITGFMRREIPEFLRRKALRSLWKSNPVLAVLDGLNDYDEDYTLASTAGQTVSSLFRVGEGMVEKARKAADVVEAPTSSLAEPSAQAPEPVSESSPEAQPPAEADDTAEPADPDGPQLAQTQTSQSEAVPEPRFRPRMRFDY
ncbi:MAG: DUF3306 domain-containing protein [Pseudomonadota bacterium]|nr:DUF3306 domain-containing protein [Pseudomonadota bacterium]